MPLPRRRKAVFATLAVALVLLLVEAAARVVLALRPPPPLEAAAVTGGAVGTAWFPTLVEDVGDAGAGALLYVPDPELFWTLRPGFEAELVNVCYGTVDEPVTWRVAIDADGRRRTGADGDGRRIVCVGDSVTFGFRVSDDETFAARLAGALAARGEEGAAVVNLAVPGYSSFQGRRLLERSLAGLRPDVVLIAFGANDLEGDVRSDADKAARNAGPGAAVGRLVSRLALARLMRGAPETARTAPDAAPMTRRVEPADFVENLREMVRLSRAAGATPVLLNLVFVGAPWGTEIERVGREEGCAVLDGAALLRRTLADVTAGRAFPAERAALDRFWTDRVREYRQVYYDPSTYAALFADPVWSGLLRYLLIEPVHPSALGHRVLAEGIADLLAE